MTQTTQSKAVRLREELGYPVLDGDGHIVELMAEFLDFVRDHGQEKLLQGGMLGRRRAVEDLTLEERRRGGILPNSWHVPASTEYYATVTSPKRYHERLPEAGIDFAVLYPSFGNPLMQLQDEEQRVGLCRLYNEFVNELYAPYQDRFTVASLVPMHTPEEGVASLEHIKSLGAKVALMPSHIHRDASGSPLPDDEWSDVRIPQWDTRGWLDTFGVDSIHDYDPVWSKAIELQLPMAAHTAGIGNSDHASISNFVYNQIGHFAAAGAALAKSLFLDGVTTRFPDFRLALQEGGVAIGVQVYISLVANWQKRSGEAIKGLNPENLDKERLVELMVESEPHRAKYTPQQLTGQLGGTMTRVRDDYEKADIHSVEDIRDRFVDNFVWGCEADDPLVGVSFDSRITPLGAQVPAIFASDLGHWDVPEFDEPLEEAYELVEKGILDETQLRTFLFENPLRFYGSLNPDFFKGTVLEQAAAAELGLA
jgi:predicted TIM-barrel fold metal-dependent hydrolase